METESSVQQLAASKSFSASELMIWKHDFKPVLLDLFPDDEDAWQRTCLMPPKKTHPNPLIAEDLAIFTVCKPGHDYGAR